MGWRKGDGSSVVWDSRASTKFKIRAPRSGLDDEQALQSWIAELENELKDAAKKKDMICSSLELAECGLGNAAVKKILDLLVKLHISVEVLKLYKNRISDPAMKAVAELLKSSPKPIHEIHLSHCDIGTKGALLVLKAISECGDKYPWGDSRERKDVPLWLRMEHNMIDFDAVFKEAKALGLLLHVGDNAHAWQYEQDRCPHLAVHWSYWTRPEAKGDKGKGKGKDYGKSERKGRNDFLSDSARDSEASHKAENDWTDISLEQRHGAQDERWPHGAQDEKSDQTTATPAEGTMDSLFDFEGQHSILSRFGAADSPQREESRPHDLPLPEMQQAFDFQESYSSFNGPNLTRDAFDLTRETLELREALDMPKASDLQTDWKSSDLPKREASEPNEQHVVSDWLAQDGPDTWEGKDMPFFQFQPTADELDEQFTFSPQELDDLAMSMPPNLSLDPPVDSSQSCKPLPKAPPGIPPLPPTMAPPTMAPPPMAKPPPALQAEPPLERTPTPMEAFVKETLLEQNKKLDLLLTMVSEMKDKHARLETHVWQLNRQFLNQQPQNQEWLQQFYSQREPHFSAADSSHHTGPPSTSQSRR